MIDGAALRTVVPSGVGIGVARPSEATQPDAAGTAGVSEEEAAARGIEFVMGRLAARRAMEDLGAPVLPVAARPDGAPVWPGDLVGSISHTRAVAVAVAGRRRDFAALGIDIESPERRLLPGTARRICTPTELSRFGDPEGGDRVGVLTLFCAKEAAYKALATLGAPRLGFHDVEFVRAGRGELRGTLLRTDVDDAVPRTIFARHLQVEHAIVASVAVPA